MDAQPANHEPEVDQEQVQAKEESPRPESPPAIPSFEGLSTGKEPWKGSGCSSRLPLFGCVIGLAMVIAFLMAGTSLVRRTVWGNFDNARAAVTNNLPPQLPSAEATRLRRNLERFRAVLERSDDPYPLMGDFVTRVRGLMEDGTLTPEEVDNLNLLLERWIEDSGIPPMQLGWTGTRIERHGAMRLWGFEVASHRLPRGLTAA
jgi:hypothetical protein